MFSSILFGGIVIAIVVLYRRIRVLEQKATEDDIRRDTADVCEFLLDGHVQKYHKGGR